MKDILLKIPQDIPVSLWTKCQDLPGLSEKNSCLFQAEII